jgi:hypothetical protein
MKLHLITIASCAGYAGRTQFARGRPVLEANEARPIEYL